MTEKDPKQHEEEAFDQIELRSDVPIRRSQEPPPKRRPGKARRWPVVFLTFTTLAGGGLAGYFFQQHRQLEARHNQLLEKEQSTATNLSTTVGTLEEAKNRIANLDADLKKAQEENRGLTGKNKDLDQALKKKDQELDRTKKELETQRNALQTTKNDLAAVTRERDRARQELARTERELTENIQNLESRLEDTQTRYQAQVTQLSQEKATLAGDLNRARREKEVVEQKFEEESKASLRIIKEHGELKAENSRLQSELRSLRDEVQSARSRLDNQEKVELGELVPFSDQLTPGQATYREPLPDGLKIPRRLGTVAVQALVNEVGSVDKAFILPGQELDAEISRALSQAILKWKFTPPRVGNTRVKAWQTVLVTAE